MSITAGPKQIVYVLSSCIVLNLLSDCQQRPSAKLGLFRNDHAADYNAWATEDEADEAATTGFHDAVYADYQPLPQSHDSHVPNTEKSGPSDGDYITSSRFLIYHERK